MPQSYMITLPVELLAQICSSLCWHCQGGHAGIIRPGTNGTQCISTISAQEGQRTLVSLSKACRLLHIAARPFLYHCPYTPNCRSLYFLVRTLSERPDLGSRVSEVEVDYVGGASAIEPLEPTSLITGVVESHLQRLYRANLTNALVLNPRQPGRASEDSLEHSDKLRKTAEYEALVSLPLELTAKLSLARFHLPGHTLFKTLTQSNTSSLLLKTLAISSCEHKLILDHVVPIIRLTTNLQILHCHECADVSGLFAVSLGRATLDDQPPLQSLTELSLTNTSLTIASLRNLLSAIGPTLTRVNIQPRDQATFTAIEHDVRFGEALAALQPWRQTLKELSFGRDGWRSSYTTDIHLLRDFQTLEILQAETHFFNFYQCSNALTSTLPSSIHKLRFRGYDNPGPSLRNSLEAFLAGDFPGLSKIEIDDQVFLPGSPPDQELSKVCTSFLSAGVEFIVHDQPSAPEYEGS